jgi:hypothetical protein
MASSGKRKTTMAKLNREQRLRERKAEKDARKAAAKRLAPASTEMFPIGEPNEQLGYPGDGSEVPATTED